MAKIEVDAEKLQATQNYLAEQRAAMTKTREYLKTHAELSIGSFGLLLMLAQPLTEFVAKLAMMGFKVGEDLIDKRIEALDGYVEGQAQLEQQIVDVLGSMLADVERVPDMGTGSGGSSALNGAGLAAAIAKGVGATSIASDPDAGGELFGGTARGQGASPGPIPTPYPSAAPAAPEPPR